MTDGTPTPARLRIRLMVDRLRLLLHEQYGARNDADCGRVLGFSQPTLYRLATGAQPSGDFIAAAMTKTGRPFEDLFEFVTGDGETVPVPTAVRAAA